jgi:hypothetical protein
MFAGVDSYIEAFAVAARRKCETLRTDPDIFEVWPDFVVSGERLENFAPKLPATPSPDDVELAEQGEGIIQKCVQLVSDITRARTPMPKSGQEFVALCESYAAALSNPTAA